LKLTAVPYPPRVLPTSQGLVYLQVTRDLPEWDNVRKSLSLAIRLEEQLIVGTIQDQRVIHLKVSTSQTITIQFTLYVVQVES
jgi:type VI secretion system protein ImpJ